MQSWGYYERTDVRDGDGSRFEPIPIRRFYCRQCKQTFSFLPDFLCRYLHYLGDVVSQAFSDWLAGRPIKELPLQMAGPAMLTVRRWLQRLTCHQVQTWLEQRAKAPPPLEINTSGGAPGNWLSVSSKQLTLTRRPPRSSSGQNSDTSSATAPQPTARSELRPPGPRDLGLPTSQKIQCLTNCWCS